MRPVKGRDVMNDQILLTVEELEGLILLLRACSGTGVIQALQATKTATVDKAPATPEPIRKRPGQQSNPKPLSYPIPTGPVSRRDWPGG